MNKPFSEEQAHAIANVSGRLFARHIRADNPEQFSAQKWISEGRADSVIRSGFGPSARIHAVIRFDDECGNGKASFSVTATISGATRRDDNGSMGCAHGDIERAFPELRHLIRWHLFDHSGPMHYVANTLYHAGDKDCHGLRKGERRQIINGRTGLPCWNLEAVQADGVGISDTPTGREYAERETVPLFILNKSADCLADDLPPVPTLRWVPMERVGEGKERDLRAARSVAVWPDATDAELEAEPEILRAMLEARLPALVAAFRADMDSAGLLWSPQA